MAGPFDPRDLGDGLPSSARRVGAVVTLVAVCSGCVEVRVVHPEQEGPTALLALFALGALLFVVFSGLAAFLASRPRRRRLLKILIAVLAGGVCGTLCVLLIATVLEPTRSEALTGSAIAVAGAVAGLSVAVLLSRPGRLREVLGRSLMTTGFHSLALPIAALISFLIGGAQLSLDGSGGSEISAVILGVKLAGTVATAGLSAGGLIAGVVLVFLGDRLLRQVRQTRRRKAEAAETTLIRGHFQQ